MELLVRNTVEEYDHWLRVFDEQEAAGLAAGLRVLRLWRSADNANEVFFLLSVEDRERAEAFMNTPESAEVGRRAGALDGYIK